MCLNGSFSCISKDDLVSLLKNEGSQMARSVNSMSFKKKGIVIVDSKVPFLCYESTSIAQNLILFANFSQKLRFFVKKKREFIFHHYILTKLSCCSLKIFVRDGFFRQNKRIYFSPLRFDENFLL